MSESFTDLEKIAKQVKDRIGLKGIELDGKNYEITLLDGKVAAVLSLELFKVVLPAMASMKDSNDAAPNCLPEDQAMYTDMCMLLVSQSDKMGFKGLLDTLTLGVTVDGQPCDVDVEFRGKVGYLFALLEYILRENCGSLFTHYLQAKGFDLPSLMEMMKPREPTQDS